MPRTIFHTQLCHTQSFKHTRAHNFVTPNLSHTAWSHTTLPTQLFYTQICHAILAHTAQLFHTICLPPSPLSFLPLPSHFDTCFVLIIGRNWHMGFSGSLILQFECGKSWRQHRCLNAFEVSPCQAGPVKDATRAAAMSLMAQLVSFLRSHFLVGAFFMCLILHSAVLIWSTHPPFISCVFVDWCKSLQKTYSGLPFNFTCFLYILRSLFVLRYLLPHFFCFLSFCVGPGAVCAAVAAWG